MMPDRRTPSSSPSVADLQRRGRAALPAPEASRESELLLGHALQRERAWLFAHADDPVDTAIVERFENAIARRVAGEPIAQILGAWGFWTLDLRVTRDTLVPRPETELLVQAALDRIPLDVVIRVADLGTGTGAIALALASERPRAIVLATDASAAALDVARENAARNEIPNVEFRAGHWYAALAGERCALLVSNPPYIANDDPHLTRGDLRFEPRSALASGDDGLDAIREISAGAAQHLLPGGWLLIEHGFEQGSAVRALFERAGLVDVQTLRDLEARERVTLGRVAADGR